MLYLLKHLCSWFFCIRIAVTSPFFKFHVVVNFIFLKTGTLVNDSTYSYIKRGNLLFLISMLWRSPALISLYILGWWFIFDWPIFFNMSLPSHICRFEHEDSPASDNALVFMHAMIILKLLFVLLLASSFFVQLLYIFVLVIVFLDLPHIKFYRVDP